MQKREFNSEYFSLDTCIEIMREALFNGAEAVRREMALNLLVFVSTRNARIPTKSMMYDIYCKADPRRYKTANRRINAAAALYKKLGQKQLEKWLAETDKAEAVSVIASHLAAFDLCTITDVLWFTGKKKEPDHEELAMDDEDAKSEEIAKKLAPDLRPQDVQRAKEEAEISTQLQQPLAPVKSRRSSDRPGIKWLSTEHIKVAIPPDVDRTELIALAMKILHEAEEMRNGLTLPYKEQEKEQVVRH